MALGPVEYALGAVGAGLLVAAVSNRNPLDVVRVTVAGESLANVRVLVPPLPASTPAGTPASDPGSTDDPALAWIGQGNHRLTPAAAAAFKQWQSLYGSTIHLTDSYRDSATQARGHAEDPDRFASASGSYHTRGQAVDVNLTVTTAGQSVNGQPLYDRLRSTGRQAGWETYSRGERGKHTWHFSYGGVG